MSYTKLVEAALAIVELANAQKKSGDEYVTMNFDGSYMRNLRAGLFIALKPAVELLEKEKQSESKS